MSNRDEKMRVEDTVNENGGNHREIEIQDMDEKDTQTVAAKKDEKKAEKKKTASAKDKEIQKLRKEVDELKDKYLRQIAEFENFRKRKEREVEEFWRKANADLIRKLLPILDDIERSLESARRDQNFEALVEGIEMIYKTFLKVLEAEGVTQISAVGQEFNPEYHEALMQVEKEDVPPNTVVEEHQKGYLLGDKILRPAKVIVSKE
ncbi:MAG: nucleotide exchange factor GrpE [candidate division KSB1 bacterium]|nr:nucleotide exchange factor GrpE [candidate division KSB1 bacterium]MDQ7064636.1 nucleotide exchange factor GrpE [candidate division KSB1 bacterium]